MDGTEPRATLARLLRKSEAHAGLAGALGGLTAEVAGRRVAGHLRTAWELVEHLRLAAEDLVAYCEDPAYEAMEWPDAYWPETTAPPSADAWSDSVCRLRETTEAMAGTVEDAERDLLAPVPTAQEPSHHLLRAAIILLDHNSYHAAQLIALRRALGAWPPETLSS